MTLDEGIDRTHRAEGLRHGTVVSGTTGRWEGAVIDRDGRVISPGVFISHEEDAQRYRDERMVRIEEKLDRILAILESEQ